MEFAYWPEVPEDLRPMNLYVASSIEPNVYARLLDSGWNVVDVRTMPNKTDGDRAEALKARLEGIRQGSIAEKDAPVRHLELEAKCYGLLDKKKQALDDVDIEEEALDSILNLSSKHAGGKLGVKKSSSRKRAKV